jgi:hypothetical protein
MIGLRSAPPRLLRDAPLRKVSSPRTVENIDLTLGHGAMMRLLRGCGFEIEDLIEIQAPAEATTGSLPFVPLEWAQRWPSAEAWNVRKVR